jgi:hypothetical protein
MHPARAEKAEYQSPEHGVVSRVSPYSSVVVCPSELIVPGAPRIGTQNTLYKTGGTSVNMVIMDSTVVHNTKTGFFFDSGSPA